MSIHLESISAAALAFLFLNGFAATANATQPDEGRVTAVVKNVTLLSGQTSPRQAALNDRVGDNAMVRTGDQSRAELTFADQSVARLWTRTIINLKDGARNLYLEDGAIFLQVPKGGGIAGLRAAGVAAEVSGTSVVFQYHPNVFKFLVLEGTARLYRPGQFGDSVLVSAGQLVFGNAKAALSDPVDFDIGHFLQTSRFITEFAPLRGAASIAADIQKQQRERSKKTLIETNLVMLGGGTSVSVVGPGKTGPATGATAESPTPTSGRNANSQLINQSR